MDGVDAELGVSVVTTVAGRPARSWVVGIQAAAVASICRGERRHQGGGNAKDAERRCKEATARLFGVVLFLLRCWFTFVVGAAAGNVVDGPEERLAGAVVVLDVVPALFELCCAMIAAELKGKDFDQMKKKYGLEDVSFTPAEEEEILKQFPWIQAEAEEKIAKLKMEQAM